MATKTAADPQSAAAQTFRWRGVAVPSGRPLVGKVQASSLAEAWTIASAPDRVIVMAEPAKGLTDRIVPRGAGRRLPPKQLSEFLFGFSDGIASGLSQEQYLTSMLERLPKRSPLRPVAADVLRLTQAGVSLSEAFAENEERLGPEAVAVMRAAENLTEAHVPVATLAKVVSQAHELRSAVTAALMKPMFQFALALGVVLFMSVYVIPSFESAFAQTEGDLPLLTRIVSGTAGLVVGGWLNAMFSLGSVFFAVLLLRFSDRAAVALARLALRLPLVGRTLQLMSSQRLAALMGVLLEAGVAPRTALDLAAQSQRNRYTRACLERASVAMAEGVTLADALQMHYGNVDAELPTLAEHAERTSIHPGESWARYAAALHSEASRRAESLSLRIGTFATLLIGGIVAVVVLALYLPMLSLSTSLSDLTNPP